MQIETNLQMVGSSVYGTTPLGHCRYLLLRLPRGSGIHIKSHVNGESLGWS